MSGSHDSERPERSSTADKDEDDVVGVNYQSTNNQESSSREACYDSNNSNEDGVMVSSDNNGSSGDSDGVVVSEDAGREDMFLDAPDDLGDGRDSPATFAEVQDSTDGDDDHRTRFHGLDNDMQNDYMVDEMERLRGMLDKTINEKESMTRECKDEMEMATKGISILRDQMKDLITEQSTHQSVSQSAHGFHGDDEQLPLQEMISECSMFFKNIAEEIQDLNRKSVELSLSHEVVNSYMSSIQNESAEFQYQKNQYMEEVMDRMLTSIASLVYVGDLSDTSAASKIVHVEKSVFALIENYNWFLYQSDQMRQCLTQVGPDLVEQNDYGVIFAAANDVLLGSKKMEADFLEKVTTLESENSELVEQLGKHKEMVDMKNIELDRLRAEHEEMTEKTNAELKRLKAELEQERHRYSNTKEKLSLAVTKGKALVQQRDSLKHALAGKTNELQECLNKLEENYSALKAAELMKEELINSQISDAFLQEILVEKDLILEKFEDIIFETGVPDGVKLDNLVERVRWLLDERKALEDMSLKFHHLTDALRSIDLPKNLYFPDVESRLHWLKESFSKTKEELGILQDEITMARESLCQAKADVGTLQDQNLQIRKAAHCEMEHLTTLLSTALVEKDYAKMKLEDLSCQLEAIAQREQQASSDKEEMLRILLEASGGIVDDKEASKTPILVEKCLAKVKEGTRSSSKLSEINEETFQTVKNLLYVRDQELALYEILLQEEMQKQKTNVDKLFSDLRKASEEVAILKEEKETLKKDLERSEDKSALIREKLSTAVKKGKGLVQERQNLKQLIDENSSEIEKLKLELEQKELAIIEYKNEISRLSTEVEAIAKLEDNLLALKDHRDQLQMDLSENRNFYNALTDSIDGIVLPAGLSFREPMEKLRQITLYLSECLAAKDQAEQQLEKSTIEIELLNSKVSEGQSNIKSLEDELTAAQEKITHLAEEKRVLEVVQATVQEQLQRAIADATLLAEADAAKSSLENTLALAEANISKLEKDKEAAESARGAAETEVHRTGAEIADLTGKLLEATTTIKTLEETISHLESRTTLLCEEYKEAEIGKGNIENELKKMKEEVDLSDSKLQEAYSTIKSLEEALLKAENGLSQLVDDKKTAEQEVSSLSAKLNAYMEELAGTHGSIQSKSLELFDHLKTLEVLGKDNSILTLLTKGCKTKLESLKEMDDLFRNIKDQLTEMSLGHDPVLEDSSFLIKPLSTTIDAIVGVDSIVGEIGAVEGDDVSLYVRKIVESFHERERTIADKVGSFLLFLNECNTSVLRELHATTNKITPIAVKMEAMNQRMKNTEAGSQDLENKVTSLEDDVSALLSACIEATHLLQFEFEQRMPETNSTLEYEIKYDENFHNSKHVKVVEDLLLAARKVCTVCEMLEKSRKMIASSTEELQNQLKEMHVTSDKTVEERDLYNTKIHMLEADLAAVQNLCNELKLKVENYQDIEVKLKERESDISSLQSTLTMKEREVGEAFLWKSNLKNLQEIANRINIPVDSHVEDFGLQESTDMKKIMYIIDYFPELQLQIVSLSHEKEELQIASAALVRETEHLKRQVQDFISHEQELEKVKVKATAMEAGLNRIIQKFASRGMTGYMKSGVENDPVLVAEELVMMVISESEDLRSRAHELETEVEKGINIELELTKIKAQLHDLEAGVVRIIQNLRDGVTEDPKLVATSDLVPILEKLVMRVILESEKLKLKPLQPYSGVEKNTSDEQELAEVKGELFDLKAGLRRIVQKFGVEINVDQKFIATNDLTRVIENMVLTTIAESENAKSHVHELDSKLLGSQKAVDELLMKVRALEDSPQPRGIPSEIVQERSIFEAPSQSPASEILEAEDVGSVSKPTISPVPSSAHIRTTWKGSSDHIALNIDSESSRLIDREEAVEDKGHVFKSLNTSGLIPRQGKMIADRIDGIWVSSDRLLRGRPGARLGLVAYWLFLHIWLLGTIL